MDLSIQKKISKQINNFVYSSSISKHSVFLFGPELLSLEKYVDGEHTHEIILTDYFYWYKTSLPNLAWFVASILDRDVIDKSYILSSGDLYFSAFNGDSIESNPLQWRG